jgi:predicted CXXCH cytochrome family protein
MRRLRQTLALAALVLLLVVLAAPLAYAGTESGYVTWTAGPPNDASLPTPHAGYATTTQKCAVCHAVHKAPADGELLLRSSAGDSCTYCHVSNSISSKTVYDGLIDRYTTEDDHGHQSPAVKCVSCHAVHGANTFQGEKTAKILKVFGIQQTFVDFMTLGSGETSAVVNGVGPLDPDVSDGYMWPDRQETEWVQGTAFCTQCHPYYADASETTVTASVVQSDGSFETTSFKTHPMKRPGNEQGNDYYGGFVARGSTLPTSWAAAAMGPNGCNSECHASNGGSYPHYDATSPRFLIGGAGNWEWGPVEDSSDDSACLRCHVWDDWGGGQGPNGGIAFPLPGGVGVSF